MILIDTGPLFALFNIHDPEHEICKDILKNIKGPLYTTLPVLSEVSYFLVASNISVKALEQFIRLSGVRLWPMDTTEIIAALKLMEKYADFPMDFADASLIIAAEFLRTNKIFTLDRNDFAAYRIRKGHHYESIDIISH